MSAGRGGFRGESLKKRYGSVVAADSIDIHVDPGEVVGLLGPNGAGKSTIFRILAGLESPDSGRVLLEGQEVTTWPMYRRIRNGVAYLPQGPSLFSDLSVKENLCIASGREISELRPSLVGTGLDDKLEHLAGSLSGGMRRRLEVLRCVVQNPRYLLLDEPFAGVDPITVEEIQQILASLARSGIAILITEHNVIATLRITHRAYIINQGNVIANGDAQTVVADEQVRRVYLGSSFGEGITEEEERGLELD